MTVAIERYKGEGGEWNARVRAQAGWTHFHLYEWRGVIERVFGHECVYLGARDGQGALTGVLPLVRVRSRLFGHYLVSMPFVNYGGPLGDEESVRALADHALALARDGAVKLLELRSRVQLPIALPVSHRKVTTLLDLPADPDALWKALGAKLRSQIKRPQKDGVEVRFGLDQVEPFFAVFAEHMRDLGTPTQPKALFQAAADAFGEDAWFGCAYLGGRAIACGAGFRWGGEFEMTWASALSAYNRVAPNMLLYWEFMRRAVAERVGVFNFGRSTPGAGTHRFKRQWGSRDEPLWWYQHARGGTTGTPSPDDAAYAWGPRLWRRLPLPVATALGPRIVRCIP
ncbi:MAG TPA: FemAB family XrtA/PEP-CTERM system-associated protein [Gemmatimonadales bacterium]|nr:FemAB family XrtA/PEP-CTERM system-associated protein [Gemmatimonadales bacterium]